jgi:hypothetical protein
MTWMRKHKFWWVGLLCAIALPFAWAEWIVDGDRFPSNSNDLLAQKTFPVLVLELGGQWTDFELKASTDNFQSLVYFTKSSEAIVEGDPDVWIYFTDDYATDPREWRKATVGVSIGDQLADPVNSEVQYVVVCPSHSTPVDWSVWMYESNPELVWSFVRFDGLDLEKNISGTKSKWNLVVPVEWRAERVAP